MSDWKQEIKELMVLRDGGGITEAEFQQERQRIMSSRSVPPTSDSGDTFGDYRIVSKIGEGGMGEVCKVRHKRDSIFQSQGYRVLKTIHKSLSNNEVYQSRFEAEAAKIIKFVSQLTTSTEKEKASTVQPSPRRKTRTQSTSQAWLMLPLTS